jgi:hypothetical protein
LVLIACGCAGTQRVATTAEPTIHVLDPGVEPRQRLRYELSAQAPEIVETMTKLRLRATMTNTVLETGERDSELPTIKDTARVEVTSVGSDGTATVTWDLADEPSGRIFDVTTSLPNASGQNHARLSNIAESLRDAMFPEEPIGIGASWQVSSPNATTRLTSATTDTPPPSWSFHFAGSCPRGRREGAAR